MRYVDVFKEVHRPPSPAELDAWQPPASTRALLWAERRRLLPQAWTAGFVITQAGSESRLCFLDGSFYNGGKWYYFPLAALFKAPLATVVAVVLAAVVRAGWGRPRSFGAWWAAAALAVPAGGVRVWSRSRRT